MRHMFLRGPLVVLFFCNDHHVHQMCFSLLVFYIGLFRDITVESL